MVSKVIAIFCGRTKLGKAIAITIFTVVDVVLKKGELPLQWSVRL